jgi:hypothetical protein
VELCAYVGRRVSSVGISLELCAGDLLSTGFSSFTPATRGKVEDTGAGVIGFDLVLGDPQEAQSRRHGHWSDRV